MTFKEGYIFRFYSETFLTNPEIKLDFKKKKLILLIHPLKNFRGSYSDQRMFEEFYGTFQQLESTQSAFMLS